MIRPMCSCKRLRLMNKWKNPTSILWLWLLKNLSMNYDWVECDFAISHYQTQRFRTDPQLYFPKAVSSISIIYFHQFKGYLNVTQFAEIFTGKRSIRRLTSTSLVWLFRIYIITLCHGWSWNYPLCNNINSANMWTWEQELFSFALPLLRAR